MFWFLLSCRYLAASFLSKTIPSRRSYSTMHRHVEGVGACTQIAVHSNQLVEVGERFGNLNAKLLLTPKVTVELLHDHETGKLDISLPQLQLTPYQAIRHAESYARMLKKDVVASIALGSGHVKLQSDFEHSWLHLRGQVIIHQPESVRLEPNDYLLLMPRELRLQLAAQVFHSHELLQSIHQNNISQGFVAIFQHL